ncbi:MAG: hypothetical protein N3G77_02920 [Nitrososphaeria archaeon]|nr:hypothetical protein [Nitrososphaeria archaeon]
MEIVEVVKDWYNKLLNRRELELIISYESSTPRREEVVKFISTHFDTHPEKVIVENIESIFGSLRARVHVHIYNDVEYAKKFERKHILKKHSLIQVEGGKGGKAS